MKKTVKGITLILILIISFLPIITGCDMNDEKVHFQFIKIQRYDDEHNRLMNEYLAKTEGAGNISFDDGRISINETAKDGLVSNSTIEWPKMPLKVVPGEKLSFIATSKGKGTITHFYLHTGNDINKLERVEGKMYGTTEGTYQVEFNIPKDKKYFGIHVYGSNNRFGIGSMYLYEIKNGE